MRTRTACIARYDWAWLGRAVSNVPGQVRNRGNSRGNFFTKDNKFGKVPSLTSCLSQWKPMSIPYMLRIAGVFAVAQMCLTAQDQHILAHPAPPFSWEGNKAWGSWQPCAGLDTRRLRNLTRMDNFRISELWALCNSAASPMMSFVRWKSCLTNIPQFDRLVQEHQRLRWKSPVGYGEELFASRIATGAPNMHNENNVHYKKNPHNSNNWHLSMDWKCVEQNDKGYKWKGWVNSKDPTAGSRFCTASPCTKFTKVNPSPTLQSKWIQLDQCLWRWIDFHSGIQKIKVEAGNHQGLGLQHVLAWRLEFHLNLLHRLLFAGYLQSTTLRLAGSCKYCMRAPLTWQYMPEECTASNPASSCTKFYSHLL